MSETRWRISLYDLDDRRIALFHVADLRRFDALMLSWAMNYGNIEYIRIDVHIKSDNYLDCPFCGKHSLYWQINDGHWHCYDCSKILGCHSHIQSSELSQAVIHPTQDLII